MQRLQRARRAQRAQRQSDGSSKLLFSAGRQNLSRRRKRMASSHASSGNSSKLGYNNRRQDKELNKWDYSGVTNDSTTLRQRAERKRREQSSPSVICWVCLDEGRDDEKNPMISPCECRGTQGLVHEQCLLTWLRQKTDTNLTEERCGICKTKYAITYQYTTKDYCRLIGTCLVTLLGVIFLVGFTFFKMYKCIWRARDGSVLGVIGSAMLAVYNIKRVYDYCGKLSNEFRHKMRSININGQAKIHEINSHEKITEEPTNVKKIGKKDNRNCSQNSEAISSTRTQDNSSHINCNINNGYSNSLNSRLVSNNNPSSTNITSSMNFINSSVTSDPNMDEICLVNPEMYGVENDDDEGTLVCLS